MLNITVPSTEMYDPVKQEFVTFKEQNLSLEHSLVSLSKWEARWHMPFLSKKEKTREQVLDYVKCMTVNQNVNPLTYSCLSNENITTINGYIEDSMTATTFRESKGHGGSGEEITSELIYYWMIALNIPFECQKWHLNRLLTLIKICNIKNQKPTKMSRSELLARNASLNAQRRAALGSRG